MRRRCHPLIREEVPGGGASHLSRALAPAGGGGASRGGGRRCHPLIMGEKLGAGPVPGEEVPATYLGLDMGTAFRPARGGGGARVGKEVPAEEVGGGGAGGGGASHLSWAARWGGASHLSWAATCVIVPNTLRGGWRRWGGAEAGGGGEVPATYLGVRGGREGTHNVTPAASSEVLREVPPTYPEGGAWGRGAG